MDLSEKKWLKQFVAGLVVTAIFGAFTNSYTKINVLEMEVVILKREKDDHKEKIAQLEKEERQLKNYYVTKQEFNKFQESMTVAFRELKAEQKDNTNRIIKLLEKK